MRRAVEFMGGGLVGFVAGSFLCVPLIAHVFSPAVVTWDASSCPAGIYTITTTARSLDGSTTATTTTAHVRLPASSISQEFSELPFGQYLIAAIARDATGRTFEASQSISTPGPASQFRGHQGSTAMAATTGGYAASSLAHPSTLAAPPSNKAAVPPRVPVAPASDEIVLPRAMAELLVGEADRGRGHNRGLLENGRSWRRVTFVDTDDDGVADMATIEWSNGEVWTVRADAIARIE